MTRELGEVLAPRHGDLLLEEAAALSNFLLDEVESFFSEGFTVRVLPCFEDMVVAIEAIEVVNFESSRETTVEECCEQSAESVVLLSVQR